MRKFLPKSKRDYAIPDRNTRGFTMAEAKLLEDIGRKMDVAKARTQGRIPSPFSRAYLFYLTLYAKGLDVATREEYAGQENVDLGRKLLREEARHTFRGVCAAFALRYVFDLDITLDAVRVAPGGTIEDVLLPAIESAPRGAVYWNPLRFYTVRQGRLGKQEVLAGVSPLTGVYPAAAPPRVLTALYWYNHKEGIWYDPTSNKLDEEGSLGTIISPHTRNKVASLMREWVAQALQIVDKPGALDDFGMLDADRILLRDELVLWQRELGPGMANENIVREDWPMPKPHNAPPGVQSLPFLDLVCEATPEYLISDLPVFRRSEDAPWVLLATRKQLLDKSVRIYGRVFGNMDLEQAIRELPARGDNLGQDLGLDEHTIPIGYVFIDQLFAKKLTFITDVGLSEEWKGLEIDGEYYLLPFRPEILEIISPEELHANTRGELDRNEGDHYIITLQFGSTEVTQLYSVSGRGAYMADSVTIPPDTFDLRFYPNFDLKAVANVLPPEDQKYYARIRLAPTWNFRIGAFRYDPEQERVLIDTKDDFEKAIIGKRNEIPKEDHYNIGQTLFITCKEKPSGFYVEDRGLCLLELREPGATKTRWDVGIDFGTSNTCVTYKTPADSKPKIMDFPVFTTTLLYRASYSAEFLTADGPIVNEGASAVLDFFTKQFPEDKQLKDQSYFPTQFLTRLQDVLQKQDQKWDFENGIIFFRNISLVSPDLWELVENYPVLETQKHKHQQHFRLKQDIKWQNRRWLTAYMNHLRKQVFMTAAYNNARVETLHFSYPKAFSISETGSFRSVLNQVWGGAGHTIETVSESEAVRNHAVRAASDYIIFDVGGGTTDIIAFNTKVPVFQTSFKLAAGQINQYVVKSATFRKVFLDVTKLAIGDLGVFPEKAFVVPEGHKDYDPDVISTLWLGLLEIIERKDVSERGHVLEDILNMLRGGEDIATEPQAQRAIQGFFLSITLLFTSLSFFAGTLLRFAAGGKLNGQTFEPSFPRLMLFGNGSKLYRMVDHFERRFHQVFVEMLREGMQTGGYESRFDIAASDITFEGIYKDPINGMEAPKVTVALGLLTDLPPGAKQSAAHVPVANIAAETGYQLGTVDMEAETDLLQVYQGVSRDPQSFQAPPKAPPMLRTFLETLNNVLPKGNNRGVPIIPNIGSDWHKLLLGELYRMSTDQIRTRVVENAQFVKEQLNTTDADDMPALEPLFIVEVAALLDRIREAYCV